MGNSFWMLCGNCVFSTCPEHFLRQICIYNLFQQDNISLVFKWHATAVTNIVCTERSRKSIQQFWSYYTVIYWGCGRRLTTIFLQWLSLSVKALQRCTLPVMVCDLMMLWLCIFLKENWKSFQKEFCLMSLFKAMCLCVRVHVRVSKYLIKVHLHNLHKWKGKYIFNK